MNGSSLSVADVPWPESLDLVVFDFDGVMTDNTVYLDANGNEQVRCHRGDGWGIKCMHEQGVPMVVLSTEENPVLRARCDKLRLLCRHGLTDKGVALRDLLVERGINPARVAYVGNDENDLACLEMVGLPVIVADAHPSVRGAAKLVLSLCGGEGAVREFCDLVLSWKSA